MFIQSECFNRVFDCCIRELHLRAFLIYSNLSSYVVHIFVINMLFSLSRWAPLEAEPGGKCPTNFMRQLCLVSLLCPGCCAWHCVRPLANLIIHINDKLFRHFYKCVLYKVISNPAGQFHHGSRQVGTRNTRDQSKVQSYL